MNAAPLNAVRIETDVDIGVTSRILDLLSASDRFPTRIRLHRDGEAMRIDVALDGLAPGDGNLLTRIGQIAGVRRVRRAPGSWR